MSAGSDNGSASPSSGTAGWELGVDRYRDATAWVIGAFGAIGAVIVAMVPIAGLAKGEVRSLSGVVVGVSVAASGALIAIIAALWNMSPRAMYPGSLHPVRRSWFRRTFVGWARLEHELAVDPEPLLPAGIRTVDELDDAISNLPRLAAAQSRIATDADAVKPTIDRLIRYEASRRNLYGLARFELARTRFAASLIVMSLASMLTVLGLAVASWGLVGSPSNKPEVSSTVPATAALSVDGAEALAESLGEDCVDGDIDVVVLAGDRSSSAWDVVTVGSDECKVVRFTLTGALGALRWP